jgi:hypothetical protein
MTAGLHGLGMRRRPSITAILVEACARGDEHVLRGIATPARKAPRARLRSGAAQAHVS